MGWVKEGGCMVEWVGSVGDGERAVEWLDEWM